MQGAAFGGAKIWNSEILHPYHSVLFTVHTNAIVVTIRITIGDLNTGVGATTKTFAPGGKHRRAAIAAKTLKDSRVPYVTSLLSANAECLGMWRRDHDSALRPVKNLWPSTRTRPEQRTTKSRGQYINPIDPSLSNYFVLAA